MHQMDNNMVNRPTAAPATTAKNALPPAKSIDGQAVLKRLSQKNFSVIMYIILRSERRSGFQI